MTSPVLFRRIHPHVFVSAVWPVFSEFHSGLCFFGFCLFHCMDLDFWTTAVFNKSHFLLLNLTDVVSADGSLVCSCSCWRLQMKWWTDCCDQLFPGFKTPRLWVVQQCTSSTPPPISRSSDTLTAGVYIAMEVNQIRPTIYHLLSKSVDLAAKRTDKLAVCCPV